MEMEEAKNRAKDRRLANDMLKGKSKMLITEEAI
jgi:hypothetical protein